MKEFDLAKALKGAKVVTRDGREVSEIVFLQTADYSSCVIAVIDGTVFEHDVNGKFNPPNESDYDLFMQPEIKTYYINVYKKQDEYQPIQLSTPYKNLKDAEKFRALDSHYIGTFPFEVAL